MNTNIEVSLINRQIIRTRASQNSFDKKSNKTRIRLYDFFSINEIKVCKKILKMPYYFNYFDTMYDFDFIKVVGELKRINIDIDTDIDTDKIDFINTKNEEKYILCRYNDEKKSTLNEYLFNLSVDERERANLKDKDLIKFNSMKEAWINWNKTMPQVDYNVNMSVGLPLSAMPQR